MPADRFPLFNRDGQLLAGRLMDLAREAERRSRAYLLGQPFLDCAAGLVALPSSTPGAPGAGCTPPYTPPTGAACGQLTRCVGFIPPTGIQCVNGVIMVTPSFLIWTPCGFIVCENDCNGDQGSTGSQGSQSGGSGAGPYWCVAVNMANNGICVPGSTICLAQGTFNDLTSPPRLGDVVSWSPGGGITCYGVLSAGPFLDPACGGACAGGSSPGSSGGSGGGWVWCPQNPGPPGGPATVTATIVGTGGCAGCAASGTLHNNGAGTTYSGSISTFCGIANLAVSWLGAPQTAILNSFTLAGNVIEQDDPAISQSCSPLQLVFPVVSGVPSCNGMLQVYITA